MKEQHETMEEEVVNVRGGYFRMEIAGMVTTVLIRQRTCLHTCATVDASKFRVRDDQLRKWTAGVAANDEFTDAGFRTDAAERPGLG